LGQPGRKPRLAADGALVRLADDGGGLIMSGGASAMGKFLAAVISGVIATVIGGLILNQLQGKGRRRGDVPEAAHLVASLPFEHATPVRLHRR
jgi:hypothetical protein